MAFEVGKGFIDLTLGTAELKASAAEAKTVLAGVQSSMRSLASFAKIALAGAALWKAGKFAVDNAMGQQRAEAELEHTLRSVGNTTGMTAQEIKDYAGALQLTTAIGDDVVLQAATIIARFDNIGGHFKEATKLALDWATATQQQPVMAARMLGMALNDPSRGLMLLSRAGVFATREQRKMVLEMVQAGKVSEAQAMILDMVREKYGGVADAVGGTFSGQMELAKGLIGDIAEGIGMGLLPALQKITQFLVQNQVAIMNWTGANGALIAKIGALTAGSLGLMLVLPRIAPMIFGISKALYFLATNPIGLALTGLGLLVAWLVKTQIAGDTFAEKIQNVSKFLSTTFTSWANWLTGLNDDWQSTWELMGTAIFNFADSVRFSLSEVAKDINAFVKSVNDRVFTVTQSALEYARLLGKDLLEGRFDPIGRSVESVVKVHKYFPSDSSNTDFSRMLGSNISKLETFQRLQANKLFPGGRADIPDVRGKFNAVVEEFRKLPDKFNEIFEAQEMPEVPPPQAFNPNFDVDEAASTTSTGARFSNLVDAWKSLQEKMFSGNDPMVIEQREANMMLEQQVALSRESRDLQRQMAERLGVIEPVAPTTA